ncbi:MAG: hypothetical protein LQ346_008347 [Caloplaca aetnensis]|nr:MAG: hypothetical protein LQ346_008347 [Caloplaca aetnensis]
MAYNQANQDSGVRAPAGAQFVPQSATNDFGAAGQPMSTAQQQTTPSADTSNHRTHQQQQQQQQQQPSSSHSNAEERLEREGHLPGLAEVQGETEKEGKKVRQPGQEDAAGNKIHRKGVLGKIFHWEHNGMNAD